MRMSLRGNWITHCREGLQRNLYTKISTGVSPLQFCEEKLQYLLYRIQSYPQTNENFPFEEIILLNVGPSMLIE